MIDPAEPPGRADTVPDLPAEAYRRMSTVLRAGLLVSVAILGGGLVAYRAAYPGASSGDVLRSNPILHYLGLSGLLAGLGSGSVAAYLTLGLLVLLATPILRVLSGFYYFRRARERTLATISLTVFALLLFGILVLGPAIG